MVFVVEKVGSGQSQWLSYLPRINGLKGFIVEQGILNKEYWTLPCEPCAFLVFFVVKKLKRSVDASELWKVKRLNAKYYYKIYVSMCLKK